MTLIPLPAFNDNYIWVLPDTAREQFYCVDPGDATPVLSYAKQNNLTLNAILLTHHHHDHIGGVHALLRQYPNVSIYGPDDNRIPFITKSLAENDTLSLGQYRFQIMETPGHTASHISYFEPEEKWLLCGDTLFSAGCGRVFDGTMEALYHSLQRYKNLPDDTLVFCAHEYTHKNLDFALTLEPENPAILDYKKKLPQKDRSCTLPSTIADEKKINPFLRTDSEGIKNYAKRFQVSTDDALAVFTLIRQHKDNF